MGYIGIRELSPSYFYFRRPLPHPSSTNWAFYRCCRFLCWAVYLQSMLRVVPRLRFYYRPVAGAWRTCAPFWRFRDRHRRQRILSGGKYLPLPADTPL